VLTATLPIHDDVLSMKTVRIKQIQPIYLLCPSFASTFFALHLHPSPCTSVQQKVEDEEWDSLSSGLPSNFHQASIRGKPKGEV